MLRHISARPEHSLFPKDLTDIVNDALRAAALAPTYIDALDIAGAALLLIADLARMEVQHA